jgi:hypothetical protein
LEEFKKKFLELGCPKLAVLSNQTIFVMNESPVSKIGAS